MGSSGSLVLLGLSIAFYLVGIAAIIAGMLTPVWIVSEHKALGTKEDEGLIKRCKSSSLNTDQKTCTDRDDILKFKDGNEFEKEKDVVLVMLIVSMVFSFLAFLLSLTMICYRRRKAPWRCGAVSAFIFGLFAVICGIAALAYAESEFKDKWANQKHGWSNIICWVGCGGIILGTIMSSLLICITPGSSSSDNIGVHYVGNRNPTYQHDYHTNY